MLQSLVKPKRFGIISRYKLIVIYMDKKIEVTCECEGKDSDMPVPP